MGDVGFLPIDDARRARLLARVPDVPRWVEVRAMLLERRCVVAGEDDACVVASTRLPVAGVVGAAPAELIRLAAARVGGTTTVLCASEDAARVAAALPRRRLQRARLHLLDPAAATNLLEPEVDGAAGVEVRLLSLDDLPLVALLPDAELRVELAVALADAPVAAAFVGGAAVAFAHVAWRTETLWDVSVDTLAEHRGRGLAALCYERMRAEQARAGRRPVWGAVEENTASLRLAARLRFRAVDALGVLEAGAG